MCAACNLLVTTFCDHELNVLVYIVMTIVVDCNTKKQCSLPMVHISQEKRYGDGFEGPQTTQAHGGGIRSIDGELVIAFNVRMPEIGYGCWKGGRDELDVDVLQWSGAGVLALYASGDATGYSLLELNGHDEVQTVQCLFQSIDT